MTNRELIEKCAEIAYVADTNHDAREEILELLKEPIAPDAAREQAGRKMFEALAAGEALVISAYSHVTHGGPTLKEAEAWTKIASEALAAGREAGWGQ